ncbi:hypothetical protein K435DRAFT_872086 [Dendrothele bispora CBS 962.96]|uniref:Uncharacterized protein n=1 Tax=Dendrothele bispora (strain CBS 962.96) TaxID=1314807 RepID=A0A4S8L2I5_DENBC|nr:hypothetical protein K435DRAFT_872086 [Dendrothele bispora CBS 962.96]
MTLTSQNTTTEDVLSITLVMSIEYFFYGLYTVLFVLSIWVIQHVHAKRNTTTTSKTNQLHLTSMIVIFILTTSAIVLHSALNGQLILQNHFQDGAFGASSTPKLINSLGIIGHMSDHKVGVSPRTKIQISFYSSFVTDCLIIYRMYLIWGRRGRIVAVPLVISVLNHVLGFIMTFSALHKPIAHQDVLELTFFIIDLLNNVVITFLNAGRIWKINRNARSIMELRSNINYHRTAMKIIIESGILYAVILVILVITVIGHKPAVSSSILLIPMFLPPLASVPTLIIVQAGFKKIEEYPEDSVS